MMNLSRDSFVPEDRQSQENNGSYMFKPFHEILSVQAFIECRRQWDCLFVALELFQRPTEVVRPTHTLVMASRKRMREEDDDDDQEDDEDQLHSRPSAQAARINRKQQRGNISKEFSGSDSDVEHDLVRPRTEEDKRWADSGVPLEPFNMWAEQESGFFDGKGHQEEESDDEVAGWTINPTLGLYSKRAEEDSEDSDVKIDIEASVRALTCRMFVGEKVLQTLKRLGRDQSEQGKKDFDAVTEASDLLLAAGMFDVYEKKKEDLARDAPDPQDVLIWEYTTEQLKSEQQEEEEDVVVHGPYSSRQMEEWRRAGYFGVSAKALVRKINTKHWIPSETFRSFKI